MLNQKMKVYVKLGALTEHMEKTAQKIVRVQRMHTLIAIRSRETAPVYMEERAQIVPTFVRQVTMVRIVNTYVLVKATLPVTLTQVTVIVQNLAGPEHTVTRVVMVHSVLIAPKTVHATKTRRATR